MDHLRLQLSQIGPRLLLLWATLTLAACERPPVAQLEVSGVPAGAAQLEVWLWADGRAAATPLRFPIDAPRDPQRLGLRLPATGTFALQLGVGALSADGCLVALGEARGLFNGVDLILRSALSPVSGGCGAARPILTSVTPARARTLSQDALTVRGLGLQPDYLVRVGDKDAPLVKAVSPTRITGPLPALPGLIGPQDVTVWSAGGTRLARVQGAIRLMLTELRLSPTLVKLNRGALGNCRGWLSVVPHEVGAGLVLSLPSFVPPSGGAAAVYLPTLSPGQTLVESIVFSDPAINTGRADSSVVLDLDGDGRRNEVVFLVNQGYDPPSRTFKGPAALVAYRIEGSKLNLLGAPVTVGSQLFGSPSADKGSPVRAGAVRPARPGDPRETLLTVQRMALYEHRLEGGALVPGAVGSGDHDYPVQVAALLPGKDPGVLSLGYGYSAAVTDAPRRVLNWPGGSCRDSAVGDVDGDGLSDMACTYTTVTDKHLLVVPNRTPASNALQVVAGTAQELRCGSVPTSVVLSDLDGDGLAEAVCGVLTNSLETRGVDVLFVYRNVGGALVRVPVDFEAPSGQVLTPFNIVDADFDGDGRVDLATTFSDDSVLVLFNQSQ